MSLIRRYLRLSGHLVHLVLLAKIVVLNQNLRNNGELYYVDGWRRDGYIVGVVFILILILISCSAYLFIEGELSIIDKCRAGAITPSIRLISQLSPEPGV